MIELEGIGKRFGDATVLRAVDLHVAPGETVALVGPSGCGKSTLLRLVVGLLEPDGGTVRVDGEVLRPGVREAVRRKLGYVIQGGGLFPHLTARDNVTLMARHLRVPPGDVVVRLDRMVALTRFPVDGLDRFPGELSGGQRQRVALMRALMLEPRVLLLDEPFGALDPLIRFELQRELRTILRQLETTVLLVTHDLVEASYLAHRMVLLRDGAVEQVGSLEALRASPASPFVRRFVQAQDGHRTAEAGV